MIYFKKLHENAQLPTRGSEHAAGLDLYAVERMDIWPGAQVMIPTGLAVQIPSGHYGRVAPRSGLAVKHGIQVHAGVVDSDYRGEMRVCLINHGDKMVEIKPGDRIAQLIIEKCLIVPAAWADELDGTERGAGGVRQYRLLRCCMDLETTVIQQVSHTDKPLKQIAREMGFTHSRHVSAICKRHGVDLQARRNRINRIIAINAAAERKNPGLIDHDKRHAIESWVSESMTGDGFSLYWLGRKWV